MNYIKNLSVSVLFFSFGINATNTSSDDLNTHLTSETALHYACKNGHAEKVKSLLAIPGINVNPIEVMYGYTPLHYACDLDHADIVRELLAAPGIRVDIVDKSGRTPLQTTYNKDIKNMIRKHLDEKLLEVCKKVETSAGHINHLIAMDADVNAVDKHGYTPLHWACKSNNEKAICALLAVTGIDVTAVSSDNKTPFESTKNERVKGLLNNYTNHIQKNFYERRIMRT